MTQKSKIESALYATGIALALSIAAYLVASLLGFIIAETIILSVFIYSLTRTFRK